MTNSIITDFDRKHIWHPPDVLLERVRTEFQTPPELLLPGAVLPKPEKILPNIFPNYPALVKARDEIRRLRWLPVKSNEDRAAYNAIRGSVSILAEVEKMIGPSGLVLAVNKYPYFLPPGTKQYIAWIRDEIEPDRVTHFLTHSAIVLTSSITREAQVNMVTPDLTNLIMFERPRHIQSPLIRGTFPAIRHVHLWTHEKIA